MERVKRREAIMNLDKEREANDDDKAGPAAAADDGAGPSVGDAPNAILPQRPRQLLHGHRTNGKETELLHVRNVAHTLIMGFKSLLYTLSSFGNTHQVTAWKRLRPSLML